MLSIKEKHARILRWSHWLNIPLISLMVWSGVMIYWAHQAYVELPPKLSDTLGVSYHLAEGMGWHFFIMWPFLINGIIYFSYLTISGQWKERFPDIKSFKNAILVTLHDLRIIKNAPPIRGKYNDAQRVAYSGVLLMGMGSVLTGLAIYKPVQLGSLTRILGGYKAARFEHFVLMVLFILFFIVHIIQVIRAGWNNLRSMIAGFEIENK
jgi:thiosulfate reductase cytochrome b subunit